MIRVVGYHEFYDDLRDHYSSSAVDALWDYFEMMETEDNQIHFDPVAIRCEYYESNLEDVLNDYTLLDEQEIQDNDYDARFELAVERLSNKTIVVYSNADEDIILFQAV
jgi:hypothetical protein